jgi:hypothetical protein
MPPSLSSRHDVTGLTNAEFFERHAAPGRVGLVGGPGLVDQVIQRAQRKQRHDGSWSPWAHAFVFQGRRHDGHHWILESNIELHRENVQIGVQEGRVAKYFDDDSYTSCAVLDFELGDDHVRMLLGTGLDLLVDRTQYSLREILSAYLGLREPSARNRKSRLAQERAMFCSAFVQHVYLAAGIDFAREVDTKLTTPEDIAQTPVPHVAYVLDRSTPPPITPSVRPDRV